jgi:hypothetical protein
MKVPLYRFLSAAVTLTQQEWDAMGKAGMSRVLARSGASPPG